MRKFALIIITMFISIALIACNEETPEPEVDNGDVLITFQDKTITTLDAENAMLTPDQDMYDAAKSLLFHEIVLVEADMAGTEYDPYDVEVLVNQTLQLYEFDEEAIAFIDEKSELNNLEAVDFIDTVWRDFLQKRVIVNNHLNNEIVFAGKSDEEIAIEVENFETEMLLKYEDDIEYHF